MTYYNQYQFKLLFIFMSLCIILASCAKPVLIKGDVSQHFSAESLIPNAKFFRTIKNSEGKNFLFVTTRDDEELFYIADLKGRKVDHAISKLIESDLNNKFQSYIIDWITTLPPGFSLTAHSKKLSELIDVAYLSPNWDYLIVSMTSRKSIFNQILRIHDVSTGNIVREFKQYKSEVNGVMKVISGYQINMALGFDEKNYLYLLGINLKHGKLEKHLLKIKLDGGQVVNTFNLSSTNGIEPTDLITKIARDKAYLSSKGDLAIFDFASNSAKRLNIYDDGIIWPLEFEDKQIIARLKSLSKTSIFKVKLEGSSIPDEIIKIEGGNELSMFDLTGTYDTSALVLENVGIRKISFGLFDYKSEQVVKIREAGTILNYQVVADGINNYIYFIDKKNGLFRIKIGELPKS